MSWTDSFPVLTDEHLEHFKASTSPDERASLEKLFEERHSVTASPALHLIALSLFPDPVSTACCFPAVSVEDPRIALDRMLVRLRNSALRFASEHPEVRLRIYLDPRWEDAAAELLELGCEVIVMAQPSSGPNPGSLWRFLALEEDIPVTFMNLADLERADTLIERTVALKPTGLKMWRTPMDRRLNYRPIHPDRFGIVHGMPVRELLCAFVWHAQQTPPLPKGLTMKQIAGIDDSFPLRAKCSERQVEWSGADLAEFFLMSVIYPRAAFDGMLSLIEADDQHSRWQLLDIEYAVWANPDSELLFVKPVHPMPSMQAIDFEKSTLAATMFARLALENRYPEHFEAWRQDSAPDFSGSEGEIAGWADANPEPSTQAEP